MDFANYWFSHHADDAIQSLRLRSGGGNWLSGTFGPPSDTKRSAVSFWIKKTKYGHAQWPWGIYNGDVNRSYGIWINKNDPYKDIWSFGGGTDESYPAKVTNLYRGCKDLNNWYHIMMVYDSTEAVQVDRTKFYINQVLIDKFSGWGGPNQNDNLYLWNANGRPYLINAGKPDGTLGFDGYIAEWAFFDGLPPMDGDHPDWSVFTETNPYGKVVPKKLDVNEITWGNNGFYLSFDDRNFSTDGNTCYDLSGNDNHMTNNGINVDPSDVNCAITYDSPGNNFVTLDSSYGYPATVEIGNGATDFNITTVSGFAQPGHSAAQTAVPLPYEKGKWYCEFKIESMASSPVIGLFWGDNNEVLTVWGPSLNNVYHSPDLQNSTITPATRAFQAGDIVGVSLDVDSIQGQGGWLQMYLWEPSGDTYNFVGTVLGDPNGLSWGASVYNRMQYMDNLRFGVAPWLAPVGDSGVLISNDSNWDYGDRIPDGFSPLNSNTYAEATKISTPGSNFVNSKLTSAANPIQDFRDDPNLWSKGLFLTKNRDNLSNMQWVDYTRGTTVAGIGSSGAKEQTYVSEPGTNMVWSWFTSAVSAVNNDGTQQSTVTTNAWTGFSMVQYQGTGSKFTIGHGLDIRPDFYVVFNRVRDCNKICFHKSLGLDVIYMDVAEPRYVDNSVHSEIVYNNDTIVIGPCNGSGGVHSFYNTAGDDYILYAWRSVPGYSSFTSYTGNGDADGPFIPLGFQPRIIWIKNATSSADWVMYDYPQEEVNQTSNLSHYYVLNDNSARRTSSTYDVDLTSNGIKITTDNNILNTNGNKYIVCAWAVDPWGAVSAR